MEKEIKKTLMSSGKIVTREKISLSSNLPFITKKENSLSNILNAEENEKIFEIIEKYENKKIENILKEIPKNNTILYQVINGLKRNNDLEITLDEIIKNCNYKKTKIKLIEIQNEIKKDKKNSGSYIISFNKQYIENEIHNLKMIIENGLYNKGEKNTLETIVDILKIVKTKEDLAKILFFVKNTENNQTRIKKLKNFYNYNSNLVLSVMTKEIIKLYVDDQISKIKDSDKEKIEEDLIDGNNLYDILIKINSHFDKVKSDNGITELTLRIFNDELWKKLEEKSTMLCWDCSNGYVSKCSKIRDLKKKNIEDYPFIVSGFQVIKNDEIERFIVTNCKRYKKATNKNQMTSKELRKAKAKLAALFYGTETLEEGLKLQEKKKIMYI